MDFIGFDEIVVGMQKPSNFLKTTLITILTYLLPTNRSHQFPAVIISLRKETGHHARNDDSGVRRMVNQVVDDSIVATLPNENTGGMWVYFADVMDMVIANQVVMVDIFRSWPITAQQYSGAADMLDMIALNSIFLRM